MKQKIRFFLKHLYSRPVNLAGMKTLILLTVFVSQFSLAQTKITASGMSAGAFMAQQLHTAFSDQVAGIGVIAGGPYYCAQGNMIDAINRCMQTHLGVPQAADSLKEAQMLYKEGRIDNPAQLASSRVYVLSGTRDNFILQRVNDVTVETYRAWGLKGSALRYENKFAVGHAFPTESFGNSCGTPGKDPFISNCKRDVAGEILNHLYGPLVPRTTPKEARFFTFDQFSVQNGVDIEALSMHRKGFAYIPEGCDQPLAGNCRIHIALHGCKQTLDDVGSIFITKTGYNPWAEANKIVILYPQAIKTPISNPLGCWDWWGYTGPDYHTKNGLQMRLIMKMVEALRSGALQLKSANL